VSHDLARLSSYVRFYQTVVNQIGSAYQNVERTHFSMKSALEPYAAPLAPVGFAPLEGAMGAPRAYRDEFMALWWPVDEKDLSDLNDIYEVVGHFKFQGDNNANLQHVQWLVAGARNEIVVQRTRLSDLRELPAKSRAAAARILAAEQARAAAARTQKLAMFEPLGETVITRAKQTYDAVKAVPFPDLSVAESAAEEYRKYAIRLDQVYQTCLPFLRKAISNLYAFVECEPGASWPDTLPVTKELPPELVTVPPAGSEELTNARASVNALAEEEIALGRARDSVATAAARLEGELAAAQMKDAELGQEINTAHLVLDACLSREQAETLARQAEELMSQRSLRVEATGAVLSRQKQIEATGKLLEEELRKRTADLATLDAEIAAVRKDEPVLFGKDEWRARVGAMDEQRAMQQGLLAQRTAALHQAQIEYSSISVELQTEQQKQALLERQIAELQGKQAQFEALGREIGNKLGTARPGRNVTSEQARDAILMLQKAKAELSERMEKCRVEMRHQKDEAVRVLGRMKQIGVERQHVSAMVQSAEVAATQGREAALKQLAMERKAGVERHVGEILGTLEKSVAHAAQVFVEPAREVVIKATEPNAEASTNVLTAADAVAPVVDKLYAEFDSVLLAEDATLGQIQREFCDVAVDACRQAWGG